MKLNRYAHFVLFVTILSYNNQTRGAEKTPEIYSKTIQALATEHFPSPLAIIIAQYVGRDYSTAPTRIPKSDVDIAYEPYASQKKYTDFRHKGFYRCGGHPILGNKLIAPNANGFTLKDINNVEPAVIFKFYDGECSENSTRDHFFKDNYMFSLHTAIFSHGRLYIERIQLNQNAENQNSEKSALVTFDTNTGERANTLPGYTPYALFPDGKVAIARYIDILNSMKVSILDKNGQKLLIESQPIKTPSIPHRNIKAVISNTQLAIGYNDHVTILTFDQTVDNLKPNELEIETGAVAAILPPQNASGEFSILEFDGKQFSLKSINTQNPSRQTIHWQIPKNTCHRNKEKEFYFSADASHENVAIQSEGTLYIFDVCNQGPLVSIPNQPSHKSPKFLSSTQLLFDTQWYEKEEIPSAPPAAADDGGPSALAAPLSATSSSSSKLPFQDPPRKATRTPFSFSAEPKSSPAIIAQVDRGLPIAEPVAKHHKTIGQRMARWATPLVTALAGVAILQKKFAYATKNHN